MAEQALNDCKKKNDIKFYLTTKSEEELILKDSTDEGKISSVYGHNEIIC
ncbi:TPA: hypothetical protein I9Y78_003663 [Elizabethkingia anophelis]|nr:hypothetical protein [Elizabethkingia anophelis]HAT3998192.1 hypothetical protein [Elizabethkingia anophelis]HAT4005741.1 hypothetical protein [Elizabethkingia anophelis]